MARKKTDAGILGYLLEEDTGSYANQTEVCPTNRNPYPKAGMERKLSNLILKALFGKHK